jgi:hypothetical protein
MRCITHVEAYVSSHACEQSTDVQNEESSVIRTFPNWLTCLCAEKFTFLNLS